MHSLSRRFLAPSCFSVLGLSLLLSLSGCGTGSTTVLVPALGGKEKIRVELTSQGPAHSKADGFETIIAGFVPNSPPKPADMAFAFISKDSQAPRRVLIEDITEESPVTIVTDEAPALKNNQWRHIISGIAVTDPRIEWLQRMNAEIRIYRFTITAAEGHKVVLDQATNYPSFVKSMISESLKPKP